MNDIGVGLMLVNVLEGGPTFGQYLVTGWAGDGGVFSDLQNCPNVLIRQNYFRVQNYCMCICTFKTLDIMH